jgi:hypothetical protein
MVEHEREYLTLHGLCRKLWLRTNEIITFYYLRSQSIELLC